MAHHIAANGVALNAGASPKEPSADPAGREEEAHCHHPAHLQATYHAAAGSQVGRCWDQGKHVG